VSFWGVSAALGGAATKSEVNVTTPLTLLTCSTDASRQEHHHGHEYQTNSWKSPKIIFSEQARNHTATGPCKGARRAFSYHQS
jgi:hypothetical protein